MVIHSSLDALIHVTIKHQEYIEKEERAINKQNEPQKERKKIKMVNNKKKPAKENGASP